MLESIVAYIAYALTQAILVVRSDEACPKEVSFVLMLTLLAPLVSLILLCILFHKSIKLAIGD